jgi:outer membrane protein
MRFSTAFALALTLLPVSVAAQQAPQCVNGECHLRLTADQVLQQADQLTSEHRFAEAAPLLAALEQTPQLAMERDFLIGYTAAESGKLDDAIKIFRHILNAHPEQTRVRLELGRALMIKGNVLAADHHFRLASEDRTLPEDIARTVRATRGVIRQQKQWSFNIDLGLAPDSNITNGTNAESVEINLGPFTFPVSLDSQARQKSGTGQFLSLGGSARFGFVGETRLLIEGDTQLTNYSGKAQDDLASQLAVGPEFDLSDETTVSVQALGSQRWYGGKTANTGFGLRAGLQHEIGRNQRVGVSLDARRSLSGVADTYTGWQLGGYATYERVIARRLIASASLFGRRDALRSAAYSDFEVGGSIGLGGELPLGINAGISAGASRAWFDAPLALFSKDPRTDWRLNGKVQLGLRSVRMMGFSPSVSYSYSASLSSLSLYDSKRSRLRFAMARYF